MRLGIQRSAGHAAHWVWGIVLLGGALLSMAGCQTPREQSGLTSPEAVTRLLEERWPIARLIDFCRDDNREFPGGQALIPQHKQRWLGTLHRNETNIFDKIDWYGSAEGGRLADFWLSASKNEWHDSWFLDGCVATNLIHRLSNDDVVIQRIREALRNSEMFHFEFHYELYDSIKEAETRAGKVANYHYELFSRDYAACEVRLERDSCTQQPVKYIQVQNSPNRDRLEIKLDGAGNPAEFFLNGKFDEYLTTTYKEFHEHYSKYRNWVDTDERVNEPRYVDGTVTVARFNAPCGVAVDAAGNLYAVENRNRVIRKVTPAGVVTTLAGNAEECGTVDGKGGAARFNEPSGIAVDQAGNLYVTDDYDKVVRKVTPAGVVTTLAGCAREKGSADGTGSVARFRRPGDLAVDGAGNVFLTDRTDCTIRKVTPAGVVTTFAGRAGEQGRADGTGAAARFTAPAGIAMDQTGNLFVSDWGNHTIRKITPAGIVTTLAGCAGEKGSLDGPCPVARFCWPAGLTMDQAGNLYVADLGNCTIRKITPNGVVTTLAGTAGEYGSVDGMGSAARLNSPVAVAVDKTGNVFVADEDDCTIRKITPAGAVTTLAGRSALILPY